MKTNTNFVEVRLIDEMRYKETHGLFVNGRLQYQGTESECRFFQLKLTENLDLDSIH